MKRTLAVIVIITLLFFSGAFFANAQTNQTVNAGTQVPSLFFSYNCITYLQSRPVFNWTNDHPEIGLATNGSAIIPAFTAINNTHKPIVATITPIQVNCIVTLIKNGPIVPIPSSVYLELDSVIKIANYVAMNGYTLDPLVFAYTNPNGTGGFFNYGIGQPTSFPQALAVNRKKEHTYLGLAGDYKINAINWTSYLLGSNVIPSGNDPSGIISNQGADLVYICNKSDNTVSVCDTLKKFVIHTIPVGSVPIGIDITPDDKYVYVANNGDNTVSVIDTKTNKVVATITVGNAPFSVVAGTDGSQVYVTNTGSNTVSVISTASNQVIAKIPVGSSPLCIALNPDGSRAYVANNADNTISVINTATNAVIATWDGGSGPYGLTVNPAGDQLLVTDNNSGYIRVIDPVVGTLIANKNVGPSPTYLVATQSPHCQNVIPFTITVNPSGPFEALGSLSGNIIACAGTPSAGPNIQQFKLAAGNISGNVTATAPPGFELSLNPGAGYAGKLNLPALNAIDTMIYVRSSFSALAGNISGFVHISATGLSDSLQVTALVNPSSSVNKVSSQVIANKSVTAPINFTGTASVYNWTNNRPGIGLPASGTGNIPSFAAVNSTTTPVVATITVTPLNADGCAGPSVDFTITVIPPPPITPPNTFTPNGDGINDTWNIKNIDKYPGATITIFNRDGGRVYYSVNYPIPWDGKYNGSKLPDGTYYYIINTGSGNPLVSGSVTIIR